MVKDGMKRCAVDNASDMALQFISSFLQNIFNQIRILNNPVALKNGRVSSKSVHGSQRLGFSSREASVYCCVRVKFSVAQEFSVVIKVLLEAVSWTWLFCYHSPVF